MDTQRVPVPGVPVAVSWSRAGRGAAWVCCFSPRNFPVLSQSEEPRSSLVSVPRPPAQGSVCYRPLLGFQNIFLDSLKAKGTSKCG